MQSDNDRLVGYPMHDWPEAWIAGCVLRLDDTAVNTVLALRDAPSCAEPDGVRIHSRLALLKPAVQLHRWREQFDLTSQPYGQPIRTCWTAYKPPTLVEARTTLVRRGVDRHSRRPTWAACTPSNTSGSVARKADSSDQIVHASGQVSLRV